MIKKAKFVFSEEIIETYSPVIAVLLGIIVGGILMLLSGYNPIEAYSALIYGGIKGIFKGNFVRIGNVLLQTTPLLLSGLAAAFAFRTGVFNIGVAGQMYFGGFVAVLLGVKLNLPPVLHILFVVIGGMFGGALWASIPAILKVKYKVSDVVSTILSNYIALEIVTYLVRRFIPGKLETQSEVISGTASLRVDWITNIFSGSAVNLGVFFAIITSLVFAFYLNKTTFGYEMKTVGLNKDAGHYAGMNINKISMSSMLISGAIAGLGGVTYYLGHTNFIQLGMLPPFGFTGIAVALLGLNKSKGVVLAALLFAYLQIGGSYMTVVADVPNEIVDTIISIIIYFSAISLIIRKLYEKVNNNGKVGA